MTEQVTGSALPPAGRRRAWLLVVLAVILAALIGYGDLVSTRRLPLGNDLVGDFFHWRLFFARALQAGHIPEWNPYVFCGLPFVAASQSGVWYPLNLLLYRFLPVTLGLTLELFLHLLWFALGTVFFLRAGGCRPPGALLGGLLSLLSPAVVTELVEGHPAQLAALAWLPWALTAVELLWQRPGPVPALLLAAALAGSVLAGHPQFTFYVGLTLLLYFLLRGLLRRERQGLVRATVFALLGAGLGVALGAAQLVPTMEVAGYLTRAGADFDFVTRFDYPPATWLRLLFPAAPDPDLALSGALAWWGGAWVLALFGARGREPAAITCALLALLTLLLAAGSSSPLFQLAFKYIPGFDLFRVPARLLFVTYLMLTVLAARGLDLAALPEERQLRRALLVMAAVLLLAGAGLLLGAPAPVFLAVVNALAVLVVLWLARCRPLRLQGIYALLIIVLIMAQAWPYMRGQLLVVPADWLTRPAPLTALLQERAAGARYLALDDLPIQSIETLPLFNRGIDYRLRHLGGSDAVVLRSFQGMYNITQGREPGERALVFRATRADHPLLDRLAVRFVVSSEIPAGTATLALPGARDALAGLYERPTAAGLFALARAVRWVDPEMMERHIPAALADSVTLAEPCGAELGQPQRDDQLLAPEFGEGWAKVKVQVKNPRLLTYAESWYPGWQVLLDNEPARLLKTDGGLMGTVVPAGRHAVVFQFRSAAVRRGFAWSAWALLVWLLLAAGAALQAVWRRVRDRHRAW